MNSIENLAMLLAIDAGNTRTKWALFDESGVILYHGACLNSELSSVDFCAKSLRINLTCRHAIISNVAGPHITTILQTKCQSLGLDVYWAKASEATGGVNNCYEDSMQLGSDRWAALVAAWQLVHASCIVVNLGTAVTIDALSTKHNEAVFLGGLILPGLHLMQQALVSGTQGITPLEGKFDTFPTNTADAVFSGACLAIAGAIVAASNQLHDQLASNSVTQAKIILSGGDATLLMPILLKHLPIAWSDQVILCDTLVLQGLYWLDRYKTYND